MTEQEVETHPVQTMCCHKGGRCPKVVTMAAYEVYAAVYGPQPAMIDLGGRGCRGGFSTGEIIGFLYAKSFPQKEWRERFEEAMRGAKGI